MNLEKSCSSLGTHYWNKIALDIKATLNIANYHFSYVIVSNNTYATTELFHSKKVDAGQISY